jgi:membrane associated rhomboid family serine protease
MADALPFTAPLRHLSGMTKWVSTLIAANVVVFLAQIAIPGLTDQLMLTPAHVLQNPWSLVTYMFIHGSWGHIFFNMLALYFFGPRLEAVLGGRNFITLYMLSGLGGALLSFMPPYYYSSILGASGAVFGVVTAYARLWPKDRIYIYGVVPVQAMWLVIGYAGYSILGAVGVVGAGTAHFGHLGGIVVGWAYMAWLRKNTGANRFKQRAVAAAPIVNESETVERWASIPVAQLHEINRGEVMRLLEKVRTSGARSLSLEERATLDRFSMTS